MGLNALNFSSGEIVQRNNVNDYSEEAKLCSEIISMIILRRNFFSVNFALAYHQINLLGLYISARLSEVHA